MTNVIFPVDIAAGVRVNRDVLVQKVRGVENVIELKALKREFPPTNLAVYGKDGRLYSFVLHYVEDTSVLDFRVVGDEATTEPKVRLAGWPVDPEQLRHDEQLLAERRGFLHRRANDDGLALRLKGVWLRDSLLWLSIELQNRTPMDLGVTGLRIFIEDRKRVKRMAAQRVDVLPAYGDGIPATPGADKRTTAVGLHPFVVSRGRRLVIVLADKEGGRQVVLRIKRKTLLRARRG